MSVSFFLFPAILSADVVFQSQFFHQLFRCIVAHPLLPVADRCSLKDNGQIPARMHRDHSVGYFEAHQLDGLALKPVRL